MVSVRLCPKCQSPVAADLRMCLTCGQTLQPLESSRLISSVPGRSSAGSAYPASGPVGAPPPPPPAYGASAASPPPPSYLAAAAPPPPPPVYPSASAAPPYPAAGGQPLPAYLAAASAPPPPPPAYQATPGAPPPPPPGYGTPPPPSYLTPASPPAASSYLTPAGGTPSYLTPVPAAPPPPPVGWTGQPATPAPVPPPVPTLVEPRRAVAPHFVFDTGLRLPVAGPGLIGRGPESREPGVTCTAITDPDRSVSKVHLEYGRDEYGLWVKDRGSTNGSTLQHAGGVATPLVAGEATRLVTGDVVTFGHRSFRVEEV